MPDLIHELIAHRAQLNPDAPALLFKDQVFSYGELQQQVVAVKNALLSTGIAAGDRVGVYLPKTPEAVFSLFGAAAAGACFVPINPLLKPRQLAHILPHCNIKVLISAHARVQLLQPVLQDCPDLHTIVVVDEAASALETAPQHTLVSFTEFCAAATPTASHRRIDSDMAAILYTSGSTGAPKGVVLSHRNMVAGANSVASYLENSADDTILAVLPLSFDAGLSQLTTAFATGAAVALIDYLLPRDVLKAIQRYGITGLGAVPSLWNQLATLEWPAAAVASLRYITNTGGAMPVSTTRALQQRLPDTRIYLMYGLTEAFRSTYLPPEQVSVRPDSIGIAIPNADILVINKEGQVCAPNEPGELVHRGALVSQGYWNDPQKTAERFRPCPARPAEIPTGELAVWSGDQVVRDEAGFLYFIAREDDMIKTSGYRVSPTEVEEVALSSGLVAGAVAIGLAHAGLGQAILLAVTCNERGNSEPDLSAALLAHCRSELPNFMLPTAILARTTLPLNQNGKLDRQGLAREYREFFQHDPAQG